MSAVVDRLTRLTLDLASPDGNLRATVDSERRAEFGLADEDDFADYTAGELAEQIAALIRAMAVGRRAGIERAYAAEGRPAPETARHPDAARRRFHEAVTAINPVGTSPSGLLVLAADADLTDCRVRVDARLLDDCDASAFLGELAAAHRELLADRSRQRAALIRRRPRG